MPALANMSEEAVEEIVAGLLGIIIGVFTAIITLCIICSILNRIFRLITLPLRRVWAVFRLIVTLFILIPFDIIRHLSREWRGIILASIGIMAYHLNNRSTTDDGQELMDGMRSSWELVKIGWRLLDQVPDIWNDMEVFLKEVEKVWHQTGEL
jgi:hypothetical protein